MPQMWNQQSWSFALVSNVRIWSTVAKPVRISASCSTVPPAGRSRRSPFLVVEVGLRVVAGHAHRPEVARVVVVADVPLGRDDVTTTRRRRPGTNTVTPLPVPPL